MRLSGGEGVAGLAGSRPTGGMTIRPLLGWRRAELAALVTRCGITAIEDPSNLDDRFDRARLRKVLAEAGWLDADQLRRSAAPPADAEATLDMAHHHRTDDSVVGKDAVTTFRFRGGPHHIQ